VGWSIRNPAMKDETTPTVMYRLAVNEDKTLFLGSKNNLMLDLINVVNGKIKGQIAFSFQGKPAPDLTMGAQERGPLAWWLNKDLAITAVPATQMPSLKRIGLLLAIENLVSTKVEFFPTGLNEQHTFIGVMESDAVFIVPGGGLVFVPVKTGN